MPEKLSDERSRAEILSGEKKPGYSPYKPQWFMRPVRGVEPVAYFHYPLWDVKIGKWYPWSYPIYHTDGPIQLQLFDLY